MKYCTLTILIALVLPLLSCHLMNREVRFKLALHQVVSETERENANFSLMVKARSIDGTKERTIRSFPLIDSRHILKIDVLRHENGAKAALKIYFDNFAAGMWNEVPFINAKPEIAIIVDGFISGFMELPSQLVDGHILVTPPMWSLAEARMIAENAKRNYEVINQR